MSFTDNVVGMGLTAEDCGIVNNSRLTVTFIDDTIKTEPQVRELAENIVEGNLHPMQIYGGLTAQVLLARATFDDNGNLSEWDLSRLQLRTLPETFGRIQVSGKLNLSDNELYALPRAFGNIQVGGDLDLSENRLNTLPLSFRTMRVEGRLYLHENPGYLSIFGEAKQWKYE